MPSATPNLPDLTPVHDFLGGPTPEPWLQAAASHTELLLIDHANCEKKAASTALNLLYRYVDKPVLLQRLSKLAREELRHFEQVARILSARDINYTQLSASRYAGELRKLVRDHEPARLVDTLVAGAFIEARSCERFYRLLDVVDAELQRFYASLLKSEARHFSDYLKLARRYASGEDVDARVSAFRLAEQALIEAPDEEFRFHSGPPAAA